MAERHAQSHDLGGAVQGDTAETLEGEPGDEPLDSGYVPPDRPTTVDKAGMTGAEQEAGEPLDARLAAEEPEPGPDDLADEEPAQRAGRLVEEDEGAHEDETAELVAGDAGISGGAASAEEAAVRMEEDEQIPGEGAE